MSALALLVARVGLADDHDATVAANDLAVVADGLDAGVDLHCSLSLSSCADTVRCPAVTFQQSLLVAVDDTAASQVVGAQLYDHPVLRKDPDVVLTHLARNVGENLVSVAQLNAKHRVGKSFDHRSLDLDDSVFLGHNLK